MLQTLKSRLADLLLPERRDTSALDRSIAAATTTHLAARRALAVAVAADQREAQRRAMLMAEAGDLQTRAIAALTGGRDDLAHQAAEAIAAIETETAASQAASIRFAENVARARLEVDAQRRRLADLDRGRRLAGVGTALNGSAPSATLDPLAQAEAALARVEACNADAEAVRNALAPPALALADTLAQAGFGHATRVLPADVMTRLRALAAPAISLPSA